MTGSSPPLLSGTYRSLTGVGKSAAVYRLQAAYEKRADSRHKESAGE